MKFSELGLHPSIMSGVERNNFVDCTPIQEAAIPHILAGHDLAGLAQTGTGKTAAFLLPIMDRIVRSREAAAVAKPSDIATESSESTEEAVGTATTDESAFIDMDTATIQSGPAEVPPLDKRPIFKNWRQKNFVLVLVPTRELAEQVASNVKLLGKDADLSVVAIYGGASYEPQKHALRQGVDFIVATPGRLIDLYKDHLVDLHQVRAVIFDEADRMFDMGFKDDMKYILRRLPRERQFLVFSATLNFDVLTVAYEFGANPVEVNVSRDQAKAENVEDEILHVGNDEKPKFLLSLFKKHNPKQAIVFSNFKRNVESIARFLSNNGMPAMGISSLMTQNQRQKIMNQFKSADGQNILVATDLAARGLDIKGVDLVINFELPDDPENYVHRIGRTGRAGEKGRALSLVSDRDVEALQRIENYLTHKVTIGWLDDNELFQDFAPFVRLSEREARAPQGGGDRQQRRPQRHGDRPRDGEKKFRRHEGGYKGRRPDPRGEGRPEGQRDGQPRSEGRPHHRRHRDDRRQHGGQREGQQQRPFHAKGANGKYTGEQRSHRHEGRRHDKHRSYRAHRPDQKRRDQQPQTSPSFMGKMKGFFSRLFKGD